MIIESLQTIAAARSRPSVRLLDAIYGPQAKELRAQVVSILLEGEKHKHPYLAKMTQYGNLRRLLVEGVKATGNCTAAENGDFEVKSERLLYGTQPIPADFREVLPPPHDVEAVKKVFGI